MGINLSVSQDAAYQKIGNELTKEDDKSWVLPPENLVWRGKKTACDVTGKVIAKGQGCVVVWAARGTSRRVVMVLFDEAALFHLLDLGSLTSLAVEKREIADAEKVARPKPVLAYQNICYCVQCGQKIVRPEGMSLVLFVKVFRCAVCQESGVAMGMTRQRYCRTCGIPFMPKEPTSRNCPKCHNQSSYGERLRQWKKVKMVC